MNVFLNEMPFSHFTFNHIQIIFYEKTIVLYGGANVADCLPEK